VYKLCFYVPESHLQLVKNALFAVGAGRVGEYDSCCWQVLGEGQFRPLPGSNPHLGGSGELTTVTEYKVEMVCESSVINAVVDALKMTHPYETPAFDVVKVENFI
tara:strand:+ start:2058 stop:2372 length:315 start_codon:yes stop_codon:yes gene_type:complete